MEYYAKWFRLPLIHNKKPAGYISSAHLTLCDKFDKTVAEETYIPSEPTDSISNLWCLTENAAYEKLNESVVPYIIKKWGEKYGITEKNIKAV